MMMTCAHCGEPQAAERHVCERAAWDWVKLADPRLYGTVLPYTPTMKIMTERRQLEIQQA
jgi:hypothetical protein